MDLNHSRSPCTHCVFQQADILAQWTQGTVCTDSVVLCLACGRRGGGDRFYNQTPGARGQTARPSYVDIGPARSPVPVPRRGLHPRGDPTFPHAPPWPVTRPSASGNARGQWRQQRKWPHAGAAQRFQIMHGDESVALDYA